MAWNTGTTLSTARFLHTDHLGSTRVCTDSSGSSAGTCHYEPFGEVRPGTTCSVPTVYRFAGMEWDGEIGGHGLYHTWFRQYDPSQGRWLGVDPLPGEPGSPSSLNRLAYVMNDPVNLTDSLGLFPEDYLNVLSCDPGSPEATQYRCERIGWRMVVCLVGGMPMPCLDFFAVGHMDSMLQRQLLLMRIVEEDVWRFVLEPRFLFLQSVANDLARSYKPTLEDRLADPETCLELLRPATDVFDTLGIVGLVSSASNLAVSVGIEAGTRGTETLANQTAKGLEETLSVSAKRRGVPVQRVPQALSHPSATATTLGRARTIAQGASVAGRLNIYAFGGASVISGIFRAYCYNNSFR